ncbi:MAG: cysteine hydrolase family protein [Bilophila wadsworthia]
MNIALVIIDMQNDFVLPEAPLCVKGAQATVPTIQKLLDRARAEGWRVIHVIRQHRRDGSDVRSGARRCLQKRSRHLCPRHQRRRDRR